MKGKLVALAFKAAEWAKDYTMTNEDLIESVISLLAVDGAVNKKEIQFFQDLCDRLSISKQARDNALEKARLGKGRVHLPEDNADKKRLLYFLVQAIVVDGKVSPKERNILNTIVDKLGMAGTDVEKFIRRQLKEIRTTPKDIPSDQPTMTCPKCGHEQLMSYRCKRCGIIFKKYKQAKEPSDEEKLMDMLSSYNIIKKEPPKK
jgi:uncharacterized tellurite resistance protein B-like protein